MTASLAPVDVRPYLPHAARTYTGIMVPPARRGQPNTPTPILLVTYSVAEHLSVATTRFLTTVLHLPLVTTAQPPDGFTDTPAVLVTPMGHGMSLRTTDPDRSLLATITMPVPRWRAAVAANGNRVLLLSGVGHDLPTPALTSRALFPWLQARMTRGWFHAARARVSAAAAPQSTL